MGVIYGLAMRVIFETGFGDTFQIVSQAFLVLMPICTGTIAVLAAGKGRRIGFTEQLGSAALAMLLFLAAMFALNLEGLICIVLVLPVYMAAALIGGLIGGAINNRFRAGKATLPAFALLPLLLGPIEAQLPPAASEQTVSSTIEIHAPPELVFDQLASVGDIRPDELGFSFVHLIGLPRPLEAVMDGSGAGSVRTSRWEKNVQFQEEITVWQRPAAMHYRFHIPPGSIPREALDRHVELGGEYFTVLDGGYDLRPGPGGGTLLTLSTRFLNKSRLRLYGDLWGRMVLADFHGAILGLMKRRAEGAIRG